MVPDLIFRPSARATLTPMCLAILTHCVFDNVPKLQRRPTRCVFLVMVMALNDFHISTTTNATQQPACTAHKIHSNIDCKTHARRDQHRDCLSSFSNCNFIIWLKAGCRDNERYASLNAHLSDSAKGPWQGKINDYVSCNFPGCTQRNPNLTDASYLTSIFTKSWMPSSVNRSDKVPLFRFSKRTGDNSLTHSASCPMHNKFARLCVRHRSHPTSTHKDC